MEACAREITWAWISSPTTTSHSPVRPSISDITSRSLPYPSFDKLRMKLEDDPSHRASLVLRQAQHEAFSDLIWPSPFFSYPPLVRPSS